MPAHPNRQPGYRLHKPTGQAYVRLGGKFEYLGKYGSPESHDRYHHLMADYHRGGGQVGPPGSDPVPAAPAPAEPGPAAGAPLTFGELILRYWRAVKARPNFTLRRGNYAGIRNALRLLRQHYGQAPAAAFGPKALKRCREAMVSRGWARTYVNAMTARIRRAFAWAVGEELLPGSVAHALREVKALKAGESAAPDRPKVKPVAAEAVARTLPFLQPAVAAMVRFQLAAGCRPAEVCKLRPCDLEKTANPLVLAYRPDGHKTAHHGHDRVILVGPKAREILAPGWPAALPRSPTPSRRPGRKRSATPGSGRRGSRRGRRVRRPGSPRRTASGPTGTTSTRSPTTSPSRAPARKRSRRRRRWPGRPGRRRGRRG
jgi:integrase